MSRGEALLAWYSATRRDLPWRATTDPYRVLVSEVMLQQTPVSRVVPAYTAFLERFPDEAELATSSLADVLALWQGLGYPGRVRRLREAMRVVAATGWPTTVHGLTRLPGIGPYTAAAVASIAFGVPVAAVDTNVRRVVSRWRGTELSPAQLRTAADEELSGEAGTWNQAVMELGALVCRPVPRCHDCPVAMECADPTVYVPPPRQARYAGSLRQVRGDILRLLDGASMSTTDLVAGLEVDADRVAAAVAGLAADGLVTVDSDTVHIAP